MAHRITGTKHSSYTRASMYDEQVMAIAPVLLVAREEHVGGREHGAQKLVAEAPP